MRVMVCGVGFPSSPLESVPCPLEVGVGLPVEEGPRDGVESCACIGQVQEVRMTIAQRRAVVRFAECPMLWK